MEKVFDLACKIGTYEKNGEEKGKYVNIGSMMKKPDGGQFILINRTFNPAGVPISADRDSIMVSLFAPRGKSSAASSPGADHAPDTVQDPWSGEEVPVSR